MTPQQQAALEALAGRALTVEEAGTVAAKLAEGDLHQVAAALSAGRTKIVSRMVSARGLAANVPGGPLAAEAILLKLEGARDSMLASTDASTKLMGSLLRRQLGFLAGDGLDFGEAALRTTLDTFVTLGILTAPEVAGLKAIAQVPNPVTWEQVLDALKGA